MRPRSLREDLHRAKQFIIPRAPRSPVASESIRLEPRPPLPHDFIVAHIPRDILSHICLFLPKTVDVAHMEQVCRTFHDRAHGQTSVIEDALHLRARASGHLLTAGALASALLREEALYVLSCSLVNRFDGWPLEFDVDTNTGYLGVTCAIWKRPWAYRAEIDGVGLGSYISAAAAAAAVSRHRERRPVPPWRLSETVDEF